MQQALLLDPAIHIGDTDGVLAPLPYNSMCVQILYRYCQWLDAMSVHVCSTTVAPYDTCHACPHRTS